MTFIALEGIDGAGKSTVCDAVLTKLHETFAGDEIKYLHFSQLKNDPLDEYALQFEAYRPGSGVHIVCDRLHWGETIYGPLYRFESALSKAQFRWVEMYLKARGATTWHVTASLETIQERLRTRGEDYLETHDVEHVWKEFQAVSASALTTGGTAQTDKWDVWTIAEQIVTDAVYSEETTKDVFRPEYIGRSIPTVLLVGDAQGNSDPGVTAAPFMPRGNSCGTFLLDALPETWWHQIGIVNANETDLDTLVDNIFEPSVVALGSNAATRLTELGITHGSVPHPQKVRRFHNGEQSRYGTLIRTTTADQGDHLKWPN